MENYTESTANTYKGQSKYYVFTWNNYNMDNIALLRSFVEKEICMYICWGYEEAPTSGTPHLQGYIEMYAKRRVSEMRRILGDGVWFHQRKGNQSQAIHYTRKSPRGDYNPTSEEWEEYGEKCITKDKNSNLLQNQLIVASEDIKKGTNVKDMYQVHPTVCARYPKYVDRLISWQKPPMRNNLDIEVHFGEPGVGKTYHIENTYPNVFQPPLSIDGKSQWYDGYYGQKEVLFDEYHGQFPLIQLLKILDKYPQQVGNKGGHVWFSPEKIFITSNYKERQWYNSWFGIESSYKALMRRITKRFLWTTGYKCTPCDINWDPIEVLTPTEEYSCDMEDSNESVIINTTSVIKK